MEWGFMLVLHATLVAVSFAVIEGDAGNEGGPINYHFNVTTTIGFAGNQNGAVIMRVVCEGIPTPMKLVLRDNMKLGAGDVFVQEIGLPDCPIGNINYVSFSWEQRKSLEKKRKKKRNLVTKASIARFTLKPLDHFDEKIQEPRSFCFYPPEGADQGVNSGGEHRMDKCDRKQATDHSGTAPVETNEPTDQVQHLQESEVKGDEHEILTQQEIDRVHEQLTKRDKMIQDYHFVINNGQSEAEKLDVVIQELQQRREQILLETERKKQEMRQVAEDAAKKALERRLQQETALKEEEIALIQQLGEMKQSYETMIAEQKREEEILAIMLKTFVEREELKLQEFNRQGLENITLAQQIHDHEEELQAEAFSSEREAIHQKFRDREVRLEEERRQREEREAAELAALTQEMQEFEERKAKWESELPQREKVVRNKERNHEKKMEKGRSQKEKRVEKQIQAREARLAEQEAINQQMVQEMLRLEEQKKAKREQIALLRQSDPIQEVPPTQDSRLLRQDQVMM